MAIEIGAVIVTVTLELMLGLATDVAAIVTTPSGAGTVAGAVNVAATPEAVRTGETEPQGALEQLTDQVTPAFVVIEHWGAGVAVGPPPST